MIHNDKDYSIDTYLYLFSYLTKCINKIGGVIMNKNEIMLDVTNEYSKMEAL